MYQIYKLFEQFFFPVTAIDLFLRKVTLNLVVGVKKENLHRFMGPLHHHPVFRRLPQALLGFIAATSLVASHVAVLKSYPFIGLMGYAAGENPLSYPEVKYAMVLQLVNAAAKLVWTSSFAGKLAASFPQSYRHHLAE